jgi:hypothetical protein
MRVALIFVFSVASLVVSCQAGSKAFNFGGWSGMVESFGRIDGVESENHDEISSKAEQALKKMIEKHLAGKKQAKQQQAKKKNAEAIPPQQQQPEAAEEPSAAPPPLPSHVNELPKSIDWDNHKETRDAINQKVPGGTEAVDALIKMLHENKTQ